MRIFVTFQIPAFHNWATAPDKYEYLRNIHRHVFHFRVEIEVQHDDRDVEMIDFKSICRNAVINMFPMHKDQQHVDFGGNSCERIAISLQNALDVEGYAVKMIEVSEDGENGAILGR